MKLIWKDVSGYEGFYQVSNTGFIKSLERYKKNHSKMVKIKERILVSSDRGDGYCRVNLWKNGKSYEFKVHRLVAQAFLKNPKNKRTVNHIDGNPSNNHLSNLEWATDSENNKHSYDHLGRKGAWEGKKGSKHHRSRKVIQKDKVTGEKIKVWGSIRQAQVQLGIYSIFYAIQRDGTAGGYSWQYA